MISSYTKTAELHPLIKYIKQWESFNTIDRKNTSKTLLGLFVSCLLLAIVGNLL